MNFLSIWTIYDHPLDFPHGFIARRWEVRGGPAPVATEDVLRSDIIEPLRAYLRDDMGLTCLPRQEGDEPQVVESWV